MRLLLIILLVFFLIAALPMWPYAAGWGVGYFPSGIFAFLLFIVVLWALLGASPRGRVPPL